MSEKLVKTTAHSLRCLFYIEQDYSFDILRPLQEEALRRGNKVRWLLLNNASTNLLEAGEQTVPSASAAIEFKPDVVFVPGDRVPAFIPGLKVLVFHGLNEDKRGTKYPERGMFDLYCTEGPSRSEMLRPLAEERGYFRVEETGWLKLDAILSHRSDNTDYGRPQILYASTFTTNLSSAEALYPEIESLRNSPEWQWLVTLHPKMAASTVSRYRKLENENLLFFTTDRVIELLHRADVMVSDNSSILQEFLLLGKPVVTYRNRDPKPYLIDVREPEQLKHAVHRAIQAEAELRSAIMGYGPSVTPWRDGATAQRIMDATESMLNSGWQDRKPHNFFRNLKMRRQLNYYRFW